MRGALNSRWRFALRLVALAMAYIVLVLGSAVVLRDARFDLTADHLYTLSPGTRHIAASLRQPLQLTLYFSDRAARELPQLRSYAQRVRDMLDEIHRRAHGEITVSVVDPQPYSEDEDRAVAAGLTATSGVNGGERIFFGLAARNLADGRRASIPFFIPDKEPFLEYDLAKLVHDLSVARKPRVGIVSGLPIAGAAAGRAQPVQPPWAVLQQLQQLFDVRLLDAAALQAIPGDLDALVLIQPRDLPDATVRALDQYVLRGGHLAVFVDPDAELDGGRASDLPKLFRAWGVEFDPDSVVLDRARALTVQPTPDAPPVRHPAVLGLTAADLNRDDPVTAALTAINVSSAGHFGLRADTHAHLVPLMQSSADAMLVPTQIVRAAGDPTLLYAGYAPTGQHYAIAARLVGKLDSAFPQDRAPGHLAQSQGECQVLLFADTDLLSDRLWVQQVPSSGQTLLNAFANNGDLFVNAVDNLAGPSDLIAIRGRMVAQRPFTRVENLRRAADEKFKAKQLELENELSDTEQRLAALRGAGASADPAQRQAVERFLQRKLAIRGELRAVQRSLDADIERLGARLKFIDILLMPILLTLAALLYALARARRRRLRQTFA